MSADEEKTKKMEQKLKDITDCCICLETFREPRILPCIHTFCLNCLEKAGAKINSCPEDEMPCPICRKEFTIPENGFSGLQKNFFMDRMVEIRKTLIPSDDRILCDLCSEDIDPVAASEIPSAEVYCVDCQQKLCQECCRHHRKSKLSKYHKIIALEGQMVSQEGCIGAALPTFCDQHDGKVLEIYCSVCQQVVCAECFFKLHKTHDGLHVSTVIDGFRERIQESTQNFPGYVRDLIRMKETVKTDTTAFVHEADMIEIQIATTREELKHLVDEHSEFLLSKIRSVKHKRLKDAEIQKSEIETLLASLESYETYCNQITTMGSASDVCTVIDNLCKRAQELSDNTATVLNEPYVKGILLRKAGFQDSFDLHDKNIIGKIEECQVPTTNPESSTYQLHISKFEETMTEPESSTTEGETAAQSDPDVFATAKAVNEELVNERVRANELNEERNMLTDRILECELKEQMFIKKVEDLERQVNLLRCLAYGEENETKDKGNIDWDAKTAAIYTPMEAACDPTSYSYRVYGIAILDNELFIFGSDGVVVINDLTTLKFKRRWRNPIGTTLSDVKHCNTNECLYMLCENIPKPNITRVDRNGTILLTWPVCSRNGQMSVTNESNILLTTLVLNSYQLCEYRPDGDLIQSIPLPWNSGFERVSHAIKLTSDHFLICHGNETSALARICLVDATGTVLKYYGEKWNRVLLGYPLCMHIDRGGNLLVADNSKKQVLLFNSNLDFKRCLIDHATTHPKYVINPYLTRPTKICIDELNSRIFIVENVWKSTGVVYAQQCDEVTVYTLET